MASLYTQNQRDEAAKLSVYDYMYHKINPPVTYGTPFFVHINTRRGEATGPRDPGAISIHPEKGYKNFATGNTAVDGRSGVQVAYALADYYSTLGMGYYNPSNTNDFAELINEIARDMGIPQEKGSKTQAKFQGQSTYIKPKNLLERYTEAMSIAVAKETSAEVPPKATVGANGYSPDATIIKYMAERGIDSQIVKDLIGAGVLYLTETQPYYEMQKDAAGNLVKDASGKVQYKLDQNGEKIPQTYIGKDGQPHPKMQYNLVFASKDQSKENAFFERKPIGKRGQAFIAPNSSAFGYFSFTGGLKNFEQVDIPEKTEKTMKAYICEAPIDAISLYALHQKMGVTEPAEYIAISGVGKDMTIQRAICEGYDCILAFDNDEKGLMAMDARRAVAFVDSLSLKDCSLPAIVPPKIEFDYSRFKGAPMQHVESKDWNDLLIAVVKGQNCTMMVKGEKAAVKPLDVLKERYNPNPKPMLMWREPKEGMKKTGAYPIEPRRFPKPFEPSRPAEKNKQIEKEEVLAH